MRREQDAAAPRMRQASATAAKVRLANPHPGAEGRNDGGRTGVDKLMDVVGQFIVDSLVVERKTGTAIAADNPARGRTTRGKVRAHARASSTSRRK